LLGIVAYCIVALASIRLAWFSSSRGEEHAWIFMFGLCFFAVLHLVGVYAVEGTELGQDPSLEGEQTHDREANTHTEGCIGQP